MEKELVLNPLLAISALDGRYHKTAEKLSEYLSEYALIKYRVFIEIEWLIKMLSPKSPFKVPIEKLSVEERIALRAIVTNFNLEEAMIVKKIEETTKHDVKAVEYYIREKLKTLELTRVSSYVHFACTSEDISNLAYSLMIKAALEKVWMPAADSLITEVSKMADDTKCFPLLGHTHGQPATTTTVGKELLVFVTRWIGRKHEIFRVGFSGKFNGAVGNFNAHFAAFPKVDWLKVSKEFVEELGLSYTTFTTQIEPHDNLCSLLNAIRAFNNVTLDFNRDMWLYISMDYFKQIAIKGEIGSSVMPHKVNPINHENSESNIIMSNAILSMLSDKLPISRLQRDLSDSSSQRNIGLAIGHSLISLEQSLIGIKKMTLNSDKISKDLESHWEILAEPIQTVLRKFGIEDAYEQLKELTRGKTMTKELIHEFIATLPIPEEDKKNLYSINPMNYTGLAESMVSGYFKSSL